MFNHTTVSVAVMAALAAMSQGVTAGTGPSSSQSSYLIGDTGHPVATDRILGSKN